MQLNGCFFGLRPFMSLAYAELKVNFVEGFAVLWLRRFYAYGVSETQNFASVQGWEIMLNY